MGHVGNSSTEGTREETEGTHKNMTSIRRLAPAVTSLPFVGGSVVGDRIVAISRYLTPTQVVALDPADDRVRVLEIPTGAGSWATAVDAAGGLYAGQYDARGGTNLWRIDIDRGDVEGVAAIDAVTIWDLVVSGSGLVVGVTDAGTAFVYDPVTEVVRDLPGTAEGETRRSVSVRGSQAFLGGTSDGSTQLVRVDLETDEVSAGPLPGDVADLGTVYCQHLAQDVLIAGISAPGDASADAAVVIADLRSGSSRSVTLPAVRVVDQVLRIGDVVWATTRPDGGLWRIMGDRAERIAEPGGRTEHRALERLGDRLVGVTAVDAVWTASESGDDVRVISLPERGVARRPERVQSLAVGIGRWFAGGSFTINAGGVGPDRVALRRGAVPGEAKGMTVVGTDLWAVIYPVGEVWRWPADGDPVQVATLAADQVRPLWCAWSEPVSALAVASVGDATGRGLLSRVGPDGAVEAVEPFSATAPCVSVATSGAVAFVGAQGTGAEVAAWDLTTMELVWRGVPVPDGGSVVGLAVADGVLVAGTVDGRLARIDPRDGTVAEVVSVDLPGDTETPGGRMAVLDDVVLWASPDGLTEVAPRPGGAIRTLVTELGSVFWNNPFCATGEGAAWVLAGTDLARVLPGPNAPVQP